VHQRRNDLVHLGYLTHFNHANIAGPKVSSWDEGYRNFDSVSEMNETLIRNWNDKISPGDNVYHLGDFAFSDTEHALPIRKRLNGNIHLIRGNHEKAAEGMWDRFVWIRDVSTVKVNGQTIFMSHYAHRVWNKSHHGVWHLYGHSHGSLPDDPDSLSFDCGVDCHNYKPLSFDEVQKIMSKKTFKPKDHHG
jgi:calcineurin-like phosphoesterase family protein